MSPTRPQRLLDLLAFLLGHRQAVPAHRIMAELPGYRDDHASDDATHQANARRRFERDKAELAALGIPLETVELGLPGTEDAMGYRIRPRDLYLPDLQVADASSPRVAPGTVVLDPAEAEAALEALRRILELPTVPLRHEARMALRKLSFDLDPAVAPALPIRILDRPGGADPGGVLPDLMDAVHRRKRVRVTYHSIGRDSHDRRSLEPWGLVFQWGCWYLAGVPVEDGAGTEGAGPAGAAPEAARRPEEVRLFRVDRMSALEVNGQRPASPDFRVPDDLALADRTDRWPWELGAPDASGQVCTVRFHGAAARLARRNGWGAPLDGGASTDDAALRAFRVVRTEPFLRWVLARRGEAEVVAPPELRRAAAELARSVADEALQAAGEAP